MARRPGEAGIDILRQNRPQAALASQASSVSPRDSLAGREGSESMAELLRDLRFGVRLLAKIPLFAATAALLLAIGSRAIT